MLTTMSWPTMIPPSGLRRDFSLRPSRIFVRILVPGKQKKEALSTAETRLRSPHPSTSIAHHGACQVRGQRARYTVSPSPAARRAIRSPGSDESPRPPAGSDASSSSLTGDAARIRAEEGMSYAAGRDLGSRTMEPICPENRELRMFRRSLRNLRAIARRRRASRFSRADDRPASR